MRAILLTAIIGLAGAAGPAVAGAARGEALPGEAAASDGTALEPVPGAPQEPLSVELVLDNLKTKFEAGGTTMWVILFLSVLGLAFLLERTFRLRRGAFAPAGMAEAVDRLWKEGDFEGVRQLCLRRRRSTLAKVILFVLRKRKAPIDAVNEAIGDIAGRDLEMHRMLTYPMLAVATLSPLLGLFGTVLGMIESFETVAVAGSMGDPTLLASGISKALVTTAFGLFVAIPALFFYHIFRLRTRYLNRLLEQEASQLVSEWLLPDEEGAQ
jgi:biopolymer transport protein ExbB